MRLSLVLLAALLLCGGIPAMAQTAVIHPADNHDPQPGPIGEKPYEMAGRQEERTPLFSFQDVSGWEVVGANAEGWLSRSQDRRLYGPYSGKLTTVARGGNPSVLVRPAQPIPVAEPWDGVSFWTWGNNWGWVSDPGTPPLSVFAVLRGADGQEVDLPLGVIDYDYWFLMHARLPQEARLARPASFVGLRLTGCTNAEPRTIYLGPLYCYQEDLKPLTFAPWPPVLPFPTRPETILPVNKTPGFQNTVRAEGESVVFSYTGADTAVTYRYTPRDGTLGDLQVQCGGASFRPCAHGGVQLADSTPDDPAVTRTLRDQRLDKDVLTVRWRIEAGNAGTDLTYRMRIAQKSLIIEMEAFDPVVTRLSLGRAEGVRDPKLTWVPYLTYGGADPHVLSTGGCFVFSQFDWYYSDASRLYGGNGLGRDWAIFNGGAEYTPKTDGTRNRLHERLFLTVSPDFQEVLPSIPNPKSPFQSVQGPRLWRVKMGNDYPVELEEARRLRSLGLDRVTIRYHEDFWRDAGESFTFRLNAAPGRGGDAALRQFVSDIKDLGWRIGLYTNYTDYAPVNQHWNEDWVNRLPDGNWQRAWPRCYAPKPMRAVEAEAELAPQLHAKFGENHSYCDVHTCVSPFDRVDYDARVPGAATFRRTFECFGRLLHNEKAAHQGPVYSEGTHHWWYAGLVDGNYGQLNHPAPSEVPLLLDFDLLKLHPLELDAGMGAPGMFFRDRPWDLDQFIATTLAYGHLGFLEWSDLPGLLKIYYLLQEVQTRYAMMLVTRIEYEHEGAFVSSSQAVSTGAYRNNRVHVVYENGTEVYVNGNPDPWTVPGPDRSYELPQWGFVAWRSQEDLLVYSAVAPVAGPTETRGLRRRVDASFGEEQHYADSRGGFAFLGRLGVEGSAALKWDEGAWWVIPTTQCRDFAFDPRLIGFGRTKDIDVIGVGEKGELVGVTLRWSRGLLHLLPGPGLLKCRLRKSDASRPEALTCPDTVVLPGGSATFSLPSGVSISASHAFWEIDGVRSPANVALDEKRYVCQIPRRAAAGQHLWLGLPAGREILWLDFLAADPCEVTVRTPAAELRRGQPLPTTVEVRNNLPAEADITLQCQLGEAAITPAPPSLHLASGGTASTTVDLALPWQSGTAEFRATATVRDRNVTARLPLTARLTRPVLASLTDSHLPVATGFRLRGREEKLGLSSGYDGSFFPMDSTCGGVTRPALFVHPPWGEGRAGYTFGRYELDLPAGSRPELCFSMGIRDGYASPDGVVYKVLAADAGGVTAELFSEAYHKHEWTPVTVDLSRFAGQHLTLTLLSDCGPANDTTCDHSLWGEPVIRDAEERLCIPR